VSTVPPVSGPARAQRQREHHEFDELDVYSRPSSVHVRWC